LILRTVPAAGSGDRHADDRGDNALLLAHRAPSR
jgi:hypothetical protein